MIHQLQSLSVLQILPLTFLNFLNFVSTNDGRMLSCLVNDTKIENTQKLELVNKTPI